MDISQKLILDSPEDAEYIVAKVRTSNKDIISTSSPRPLNFYVVAQMVIE
jgi:hypothetical protein